MQEGMVEIKKFLIDDQVIKENRLRGITEIILNLDELGNTDNLEDGRPINSLLNYHVTLMKILRVSNPTSPSTRNLRTESLLP